MHPLLTLGIIAVIMASMLFGYDRGLHDNPNCNPPEHHITVCYYKVMHQDKQLREARDSIKIMQETLRNHNALYDRCVADRIEADRSLRKYKRAVRMGMR
jgi:hypothetical protein